MTKILKHIRRWNVWRKRSLNGPVHKVLVLFGLIRSPTFNCCLLPEEIEELLDALEKELQIPLRY